MVSTLGHILASIKPAKFPLSQTSSQFPCSAQLSLPAPVCSKSAFPEHYTRYLGTDLINVLYHRTLVLTIVSILITSITTISGGHWETELSEHYQISPLKGTYFYTLLQHCGYLPCVA